MSIIIRCDHCLRDKPNDVYEVWFMVNEFATETEMRTLTGKTYDFCPKCFKEAKV